jgi:hypothetical protein
VEGEAGAHHPRANEDGIVGLVHGWSPFDGIIRPLHRYTGNSFGGFGRIPI